MRAGVAAGRDPSEAKRRAKREAPGRTFEALTIATSPNMRGGKRNPQSMMSAI